MLLISALFYALFLKLEIQHLEEAFFYNHMVAKLQSEDIRSDFLNGENGAVQLSNEQLSQLDQLYKLLGPGLPNEQADLSNHFHALAENHILLVKGKNKEIAGTTYKILKDLLSSIKKSGYFSRPSKPIEDGISSDDMQEENLADKLESVSISAEQPEDVQSLSNDQQDSTDVVAPVQNRPLQDLRASQMDPAVVAVNQMAPSQNVNFAMNPYPSSPPHESITPPLVNGNEPHEMTGAAVPVSQVSPIPNAIPRTVPPALTSVQHDFDPSHPIPTQSFAVMQNMIMQQGYVPMTMHHGPLPHHMAPIAVVPAPVPVTTVPAPVMPKHVPVTVPVPDGSVPAVMEAKLELEEPQPINENNDEADSSSNEPSGEKGAETNEYDQIQGMQQRNEGGGNTVVEEYSVPEKMVGLITGHGGEQIIRLQTETGCKIQLASDSDGNPNRPCTLTGSRESVEAVKSMIDQIIIKANSPFPPEPGQVRYGQFVTEMLIPQPKVGLLIGKGGKNIRNLQEKGGVKMVLIQERPQQTIHDKPLRISGDSRKDEPMSQGGPPRGPNPEQGGPQGQYPGPQDLQQYQQPGPGQPYATPGWPGGTCQPRPNQLATAGVAVASYNPSFPHNRGGYWRGGRGRGNYIFIRGRNYYHNGRGRVGIGNNRGHGNYRTQSSQQQEEQQ